MTKRDDVVSNALWGVSHEPDIHYSQKPERFEAIGHPRQLPLSTDCSAFYTLCCNWAGVPDPNGVNYNHYGFTGTLLNNMEEIPIEQALPGDAIVYGPATGDHVVMKVDDGENIRDPWVVSHGQERGPIKVRHSVEVRSHRAPVRVLRLAGVDEDGGLHMDADVDARFRGIEMRLQELHDHLIGDTNIEGRVAHIERMLNSDIIVDNNTLTAVTSALNQLKDDVNAMRKSTVGPAANET